ncbi:ABC transporter permease [Bacillus chungangensis]|uniref:ABC-type transport system involved in multi-copper enzyme maturation permease subunit n=1 Tax=Bacillus chungangensis TaxID=587633 RepID=A0ABT9WPB0_9BACI|nr:ABC transporter permease [Bacillus chungangensis]MDQ0174978.1 ABC-type transport system involved in multi-copper enzyme maturation permease subunit [Bacillus chungangensis]
MLKLIKLEWKKHHLSSYFKGLLICIVAIFALEALIVLDSKGESEPMFTDYAEFMLLTNVLNRIVFIIFSSVILSRLVINEYKNKTIQLLFAYPLRRKKLIQAKLSIVFGFCFSSIIISTLVINILTFFLNPIIGLFEAPVSVNEMITTIPSTLTSALATAGISLIPLYFGMRKKSAATTITSSVIIGFLINAEAGSSSSLLDFIGVPIVLCLSGLTIGYLSYHKIDKIDVA